MKTPHPIRIVSLVFVILGLGLLVGPMIWKKIHSNKMVALAEKLPPECKPSFKLVGPSARTTSISRQPKVVQGTVAQDRLVRTPEDAHLVKLAKKQKFGPETAYSFTFSAYDADFASKCAAAMLDQTDPGGQLRGTAADGTSRSCTDDLQALGDDFRTLIAEVASAGRKLRLTLRPGTDTLTVQAGTDISENDVTLLVDRAVKIAAGL